MLCECANRSDAPFLNLLMAKKFARRGRRFLGLSIQNWIKAFFAGNAGFSIVILILICLFLIQEAVRFFPSEHQNLKLSRKTGQEYVDFLIQESQEFQVLARFSRSAYSQEFDARFGKERGLVDSFEVFVGLIEDGAEDEIEALEDAEDNEALEAAQERYFAAVAQIVEQAERSDVDTFGRLEGEDALWEDLCISVLKYDAVEEEVPDFIEQAERKMTEGMASFKKANEQISDAGLPLKILQERLKTIAKETRKAFEKNEAAKMHKEALLKGAEKNEDFLVQADEIEIVTDFPFSERVAPIVEARSEHVAVITQLKADLKAAVATLPRNFSSPEAEDLVKQIREVEPQFAETLDVSLAESGEWKWDADVGWWRSFSTFFFGQNWLTHSDWRELYGFLPLFTGSVIISLIALAFSVPVSIGAAIYVNRLSSKLERSFMKPAIEMIQAIPSIVLGFFGIMVLGDFLVGWSAHPFLSWFPGFPITERLNMLNAGLLLALMAVPTIFTLCEDALNNVPRSFTEASLALGASKLQTVNKVVVPAAISGILAAVLLGFGRVIGETMVVLLVAGNKISMPDWSAGLAVVTQPSHTMTGIIAQEMSDATKGTLQYRALFLIGLVLFTISLLINVVAQEIIKRLGVHEH